MKLVVMGGAGYLGSAVASALCEAGHDVTVCDNLATGNAWAVLPDARFVPADLMSPESLELVFRGGCDAVLHFAGLALAGSSIRDPLRYLQVNLAGSLNLLEAMQAHGIHRLVYASSGAVYGQPDRSPVTESTPCRPTTPYAASKLAVEDAIGFQAAAGHLGAVSLRYFNVAGARGPLGEWHHPETHLIPATLQVAAGIRGAVPIYGTDYDTPDGTAVRDYVHIADVTRAHALALEATLRPGHRIYNLGSGEGHTVREVVDAVRLATGHAIPAVEAPRRRGDVASLVASVERIRSELGWVPARSELATIVYDAWNWMRAHLGSREPATSKARA